jgi:hypothetical protein
VLQVRTAAGCTCVRTAAAREEFYSGKGEGHWKQRGSPAAAAFGGRGWGQGRRQQTGASRWGCTAGGLRREEVGRVFVAGWGRDDLGIERANQEHQQGGAAQYLQPRGPRGACARGSGALPRGARMGCACNEMGAAEEGEATAAGWVKRARRTPESRSTLALPWRRRGAQTIPTARKQANNRGWMRGAGWGAASGARGNRPSRRPQGRRRAWAAQAPTCSPPLRCPGAACGNAQAARIRRRGRLPHAHH